MSTIKLEIEVSADNAQLVGDFLLALGGGTPKNVAKFEVKDAEEVKASEPKKASTPRPSRAKPKPAPVEEETDEDEDFADGLLDDEAGEEDEEITADDLRALQATKVDKFRAEIKAQYAKLGATGLSSLDPKHFQKMYDFLAKLK